MLHVTRFLTDSWILNMLHVFLRILESSLDMLHRFPTDSWVLTMLHCFLTVSFILTIYWNSHYDTSFSYGFLNDQYPTAVSYGFKNDHYVTIAYTNTTLCFIWLFRKSNETKCKLMLFLRFIFDIVCHVSKLILNDHCSFESVKKIKVSYFRTGKPP